MQLPQPLQKLTNQVKQIIETIREIDLPDMLIKLGNTLSKHGEEDGDNEETG